MSNSMQMENEMPFFLHKPTDLTVIIIGRKMSISPLQLHPPPPIPVQHRHFLHLH